jgi:hypothetical protein
MDNPYHELLMSFPTRLLALQPADVRRDPHYARRLPRTTDWIKSGMTSAEVANHLVVGAYAWRTPGSRWHGDPALLTWCVSFLEDLSTEVSAKRFFGGQPDATADVFTAVPLLEAHEMLKHSLPAVTRERFLTAITGVLDDVLARYARHPENRVGLDLNPYPNPEVLLAVALHHLHRLTGKPRYAAEGARFLKRVERAQFEDGGWTYYRGTNECPPYHGLVVGVLARMAPLTGDQGVIEQLRRSVPYYSMSVAPNGVAEVHTACWWKHPWETYLSFGPDAVASVTGDGQNRWVGDLTRPYTIGKIRGDGINNGSGFQTLYGAWAWREATPVEIPLPRVIYDRNIEGPRGYFPAWSWAATARYGCDTLVGALLHDPGGITALRGVTAEVPYWRPDGAEPEHGTADLFMTPPGTRGETRLFDGGAEFRAEYQLMCGQQVWDGETFPYQWRCRQHWRMDAERMRGRIEVVSLNNQRSRLPRIRVKWGLDATLEERPGGVFAYGPFELRSVSGDLRQHRVCTTDSREDRVEIQWLSDEGLGEQRVGGGRAFAIELELVCRG